MIQRHQQTMPIISIQSTMLQFSILKPARYSCILDDSCIEGFEERLNGG